LRVAQGPFDRSAGQRRFRELVNPALKLHTPPLELLTTGRVIESPADDLRPLVVDPLGEDVEPEVREPMAAAVRQFLERGRPSRIGGLPFAT
jgi:hypothetical protein